MQGSKRIQYLSLAQFKKNYYLKTDHLKTEQKYFKKALKVIVIFVWQRKNKKEESCCKCRTERKYRCGKRGFAYSRIFLGCSCLVLVVFVCRKECCCCLCLHWLNIQLYPCLFLSCTIVLTHTLYAIHSLFLTFPAFPSCKKPFSEPTRRMSR